MRFKYRGTDMPTRKTDIGKCKKIMTLQTNPFIKIFKFHDGNRH